MEPLTKKPRTEAELYVGARKKNNEKPRTREELLILLALEIKKTQALTEALERATKMDVN